MTLLAEDIPKTIGAAAKILDALTANEQANSSVKSIEKIIESLTELSKLGLISTDILLEKINNISVNKKFGLWRGHMKEMKIKLGDASEEK